MIQSKRSIETFHRFRPGESFSTDSIWRWAKPRGSTLCGVCMAHATGKPRNDHSNRITRDLAEASLRP